jgi:rfaE bifunctional protein nucleotidyltransferase chain/domain
MIINNSKVLIKVIKKHQSSGKKIGLCHGVFDVLHSGHVLHFEEAKKNCDILVASITSDRFVNKGPGRPFLNQNLRSNILKSIKFIDYVYINNEATPINLILKTKPDIYFKGQDYINSKKDLTNNIKREIKTIKKVKGQYFNTKTIMFSSSKIISEQFNNTDDNFLKVKNKINKDYLKKELNNLLNKKIDKKILVIGEPIIDQYTKVDILGKSAKNNVIATNFLKKNFYGGGSILVANLLSNFFESVDFLTFNKIKNNKNYNKFVRKNVNKIYINCDNELIIKNRYLDNYTNERLFQINKNNNFGIKKKFLKSFLLKLKNIIKKYDKIVVLDFGHNLFNKDLVKIINKNSHKTIINCQSNSSNFGFNLINKYRSAFIVSMDEIEFRLSVNDKNSPIEYLLKKNSALIKKFKKFVVTRGKNGSYIVENKKISQFPSLVKSPVDTTGSGDIFFAMLVVSNYFPKANNIDKSLLSHLAAGMHSLKLGNECIVDCKILLKNLEHLIP